MRVFALFTGLVLSAFGYVKAADPVITVLPKVPEYTLVHVASDIVPDEWNIIGPNGLLEQNVDWVSKGVVSDIVFTGVPGRYYIVIGYTTANGEHLVKSATVLIEGDGPVPPPPPPPPPPPLSKLWVVFVYESNDVDDKYPWLGNIISSQKIRKLKSDNVSLLYVDKDELDEKDDVPVNTRAWIKYASDNDLVLPVMFLANQDGKIISSEIPPKTVDETLSKIQQYIPKGNVDCPTGNCPKVHE